MAKQYYLGIDNQQLGPFHKDELLLNGMTEETLVWTEGMSDWLPAKEVAELSSLLSGTVPLPPSPPSSLGGYGNFDVSSQFGGLSPALQGYTPRGSSPTSPLELAPSSYLGGNITLTVISLLMCCFGIAPLITGILGITKSAKVNKAYNSGNHEEAIKYSRQAKTFFFVTLGLTIASAIILAVAMYFTEDEKYKIDSMPVETEQSISISSSGEDDVMSFDDTADTADDDENSEE